MVHTVFNPQTVNLRDVLYTTQKGGYYFAGVPRQRGAGVGDVLRSLWRFVLPIVKTIGQEGVASGANILSDIGKGVQPKDAFKSQTIAGTQRLLQKASENVGQIGHGRRRKVTRVKGRLVKPKSVNKINKFDIFGTY